MPYTIRDLYEAFILNRKNGGLSPRTLDFYADKLGKFLDWCDSEGITEAADLNEDHLDKFQAHEFERGCQPGGVGASSRAIKALINFGYKRGKLPRRLEITIPKNGDYRPRFLCEDEIKLLFAAIDTGLTRQVERDTAMLALLIDSGLRKSEAVALNWGDLLWDSRLGIGVVKVRIGKGGKSRQSHFTRETWELIEVYRASLPKPPSSGDPFLVSERSDKRLSGTGLHLWIKRLSERSGVDIRLHGLRHTFGRQAAMRLPLPVVQRMLGHAQISTTMIYASPSDQMAAEAYARGMATN